MSLLFSLLMKADAGQAKAELRSLSSEVAKGKTEIAGMGNAAAVADGKVDALGNASARAAAQNDKLAQSQTRVHASAGMAAGSMGNLVSQFNDIGMMNAAGQNPLQVAIQQGTQITQVIGPMGAAGAVRALGGAFLSALSPINLVTLGVIAFGSMAVQWLMSGEEAALSFEDAIENLHDATENYAKTAGQASASQADLRKEFGQSADEARKLLAVQTELDLRKAMRAASGTGRQIADELNLDLSNGPKFGNAPVLRLADLFDVDLIRDDAIGLIGDVIADFKKLESAVSFEDKIAAAQSLGESYRRAAMASGDISEAEDLVLQKINAQVLALMELRGAREQAARANFEKSYLEPAKEAVRGFIDRGVEIAEARELLGTLEQQASVRALINQYGRDSEIVALARLEAERAAFAEMVAGLGISESLKLELMAAWDAANGIASARIAAMLEQALGPASRLTGLLKTAAGYWTTMKWQMSLARADASAGPGFESGGRMGDAAGPVAPDVPTFDELYERGTRGVGAGSGGGAAARDERDAVAELIEKLREEQEVLAETDPVKREMLKYRTQLAEASAAERAEVEGLIRAEMQLKAIQAAREYATDVVGDFLDQIIAKGGKASDVLKNLAAQFLSMAARSLLSGSGWFADLLGISGPLFGGGKTAASVLGSGKVAASYEPVAARLGLSSGKAVSSLSAAPARVPPVFNINVNGATGNEEVRKMTAEGVRAGLKHYDTYVLPGRVDEIKRKPRDR